MNYRQMLNDEGMALLAQAQKNPSETLSILKKVRSRAAAVCEGGHYHGNPVCPCLGFSQIESTLKVMIKEDPALTQEQQEARAHRYLQYGRYCAQRMRDDYATKHAGGLLGKVYGYFLDGHFISDK